MNRLMRILMMFDLPVKTKAERRSATQFRNFLVGDGYHMVHPQAGRRDPVLFCVLLWKNEILPSAALHGHAEIEKPAAGAECVELLGEEQ